MNRTGLLISSDLWLEGNQLNGRRWAAQSWLREWVQATDEDQLNLLVASVGPDVLRALQQQFGALGWTKTIALMSMSTPQQVVQQGCGVLFIPDPSLGRWAQWRRVVGGSTFSLVGQIHTISSQGSQALLQELVTEPVMPWDAVVCSSTAGRAVVEAVLDDREGLLVHRTGGSRQILRQYRPQLPVIPLPLDLKPLLELPPKEKARQALGLDAHTAVVLWLGRLSLYTKQDPWFTYRVIDRVAQQLNQAVVLIECGPDDSPEQAHHFHELRQQCRSLRFLRLGGDQPVPESTKHLALAAADLAVSFVDNTQETFGLAVAEAMAAGLPVVASNWDGYRDLVSHGQHGFLVPTRWSSTAVDLSFPLGWMQACGLQSYVAVSGALAQLVQLDAGEAEQSVLTLLGCPNLANAMGKAAQRHAVSTFAGDVVMEQHKLLFDELTQRRTSEAPALNVAPVPPALIHDPVRCFQGYPAGSFGTGDDGPHQPVSNLVSQGRAELWNLLKREIPQDSLDRLHQSLLAKHS